MNCQVLTASQMSHAHKYQPLHRTMPLTSQLLLANLWHGCKPEAWNHALAANKVSALVNCIQHRQKKKAGRQRKLWHDLCVMQQDSTNPFFMRRQRQRRERRGGAHICAISGTSGSSGLGSVSSEQIDSSTCAAKPVQAWW